MSAWLFTDLGWVVETASSCDEAVDVLLSFEPSVVVSDVRMPGVQGDEFCRMIKSKRDTRVVLYSALSPSELASRAQAAGADGSASKEQGTSALLEAIANFV